MNHAQYLRIMRLPGQIDLAKRRLEQLQKAPPQERNYSWYRATATIQRKVTRLRARAIELGLRELGEQAA